MFILLRFVLFLDLDLPVHQTLATNLSSCFSHQQLELEPGIATELGQDPCLVFSFLLYKEAATFILGVG